MLKIDDQTYAQNPIGVDAGFQFGRAVFETLPIYRKPVLWQAHLARLNHGLKALSIRPPIDALSLLETVFDLSLNHCVLKIIVSPQNLILTTRPLPAAQDSCRLTLQPDMRSRQPLLLRHKTVQYLAGLLAFETAQKEGFDDALFLNPAGQITECSRSNLFFYRQGRLYTPDAACGLLPGVVRQWILDTQDVRRGHFASVDLSLADAVFITNSVIGIRRVDSIDKETFRRHAVVATLQERYQRDVLDPAK